MHLALAWDETSGIRFYIDGKLMATKAPTGLFDTALDQFGPHSRIIAPTGVEASYSYDRGGDIDELRIYDRMLSDDNMQLLAKNEIPRSIPAVERTVAAGAAGSPRRLHLRLKPMRQGTQRIGRRSGISSTDGTGRVTRRWCSTPPTLRFARWRSTMCTIWPAGGGRPPTVFARLRPGVFNRSRLIGRDDFYELPDWDCYSLSGKAVTFDMPDEPRNHLEIAGGAWGNMSLLAHDMEKGTDSDTTLFERARGGGHLPSV